VLVDSALPQSATMIADNIRTLGFRVEAVELIVNSHIHYDHAGGIAGLQRLTGARVAASPSSASGRDRSVGASRKTGCW
jgi:metallo-beta-lactamase class B